MNLSSQITWKKWESLLYQGDTCQMIQEKGTREEALG